MLSILNCFLNNIYVFNGCGQCIDLPDAIVSGEGKALIFQSDHEMYGEQKHAFSQFNPSKINNPFNHHANNNFLDAANLILKPKLINSV